jgi:hypothetical protein
MRSDLKEASLLTTRLSSRLIFRLPLKSAPHSNVLGVTLQKQCAAVSTNLRSEMLD